MPERINLQKVEITGESDGPHLLITGGVHGDEFEPMAAIRALRTRIEPAKLRGRITLVPVVNESAYRNRTREGEDGLDLARICPGRSDGSVTQRTAAALSALIETADLYIDLHCGGVAYDAYELAGYTLHPDADVLDTQRRMAKAFNLPLVWGTNPQVDGRSISVARDAKVPAIYAEWHGEGRLRPEGIGDYIDGCLNVMAQCDMIDRNQPPSRIKYVVEDASPLSGDYDLYNQSAIEGCFVPSVELGQFVGEGDSLGTVTDVLGDAVQTVRSSVAGMVVCVRTYPYVPSGKSVAIVIDVRPGDQDKKERAGGP